jgi:hypothetical protein
VRAFDLSAVHNSNIFKAAFFSALSATSRATFSPEISTDFASQILALPQIHREPHLHYTAVGTALLMFYRLWRSRALDCTSTVRYRGDFERGFRFRNLNCNSLEQVHDAEHYCGEQVSSPCCLPSPTYQNLLPFAAGNRGLWTGIFWGLFQMCIIPGECVERCMTYDVCSVSFDV